MIPAAAHHPRSIFEKHPPLSTAARRPRLVGCTRRDMGRLWHYVQEAQQKAREEKAAAEAIENLRQFQDVGRKVVTLSRFSDGGLPEWIEEHHSLPVPGIVAVEGLSKGDAEAVYIACLNGDTEALRTLLAEYLEPPAEEAAAEAEAEAAGPAASAWKLVDRYGWEPPAIAASKGHLETLELLLQAGCNADARNTYTGRNALHRCTLLCSPPTHHSSLHTQCCLPAADWRRPAMPS